MVTGVILTAFMVTWVNSKCYTLLSIFDDNLLSLQDELQKKEQCGYL